MREPLQIEGFYQTRLAVRRACRFALCAAMTAVGLLLAAVVVVAATFDLLIATREMAP